MSFNNRECLQRQEIFPQLRKTLKANSYANSFSYLCFSYFIQYVRTAVAGLSLLALELHMGQLTFQRPHENINETQRKLLISLADYKKLKQVRLQTR